MPRLHTYSLYCQSGMDAEDRSLRCSRRAAWWDGRNATYYWCDDHRLEEDVPISSDNKTANNEKEQENK